MLHVQLLFTASLSPATADVLGPLTDGTMVLSAVQAPWSGHQGDLAG
jgi:hypothetical protein